MLSHFIAFVLGGLCGVGLMCAMAIAADEDDDRWW